MPSCQDITGLSSVVWEVGSRFLPKLSEEVQQGLGGGGEGAENVEACFWAARLWGRCVRGGGGEASRGRVKIGRFQSLPLCPHPEGGSFFL